MTFSGRNKNTADFTSAVIPTPRIIIAGVKTVIVHPSTMAAQINVRIFVASICRNYFIALQAIRIHHIGEMTQTSFLVTIATNIRPYFTDMALQTFHQLTAIGAVCVLHETMVILKIEFVSATLTLKISQAVLLNERHLWRNV